MRYLLSLLIVSSWLIGYTQTDSLDVASKIFGIPFTQGERDSLRTDVSDYLQSYRAIRAQKMGNEVPFSLMLRFPVNQSKLDKTQTDIDWNLPEKMKIPKNKDELAFYSLAQLAVLIRDQKITSEELTVYFIDRLKKFGDTLECVITITEELALEQARQADKEIANGEYRGPLHGIPYGAKDLLAVAGYPTTWGAAAYKDQELSETATVVRKLEEAGAILIAKLTLGALAWGDVWYDGTTRNPWNLEQGSSGSSAGSASATAAGLVPFAIGSETWGSIVSPSTRCGTTGLRPTYGRVSKYGAMALSWSMDKLGPICRSVEDCAMVFDAIYGPDEKDLQTVDYPFNYSSTVDLSNIRVGYLEDFFKKETGTNYQNDSSTLEVVRGLGVELIPKKLPDTFDPGILSFILTAEAAAAFDELTLSDQDDLLVRQIKNAWPNVFRGGRYISAVEYIQANRLRYLLVEAFNAMMDDIDVLLTPSFGPQLLMTNLTGHPCVVFPNGSYGNNNPGSITVLANHYDEATLLAFGKKLQEATTFHLEHPELFK